jgi:hypothetical protein
MARKSSVRTERDKLIASMTPLVLLPEFQEFIEQVRQMKDYTVESMVHSTTVASERESLALVGEIRAYLWFIETAKAQREQLEAQAKAAQEQQQG